MDVKDAVEKLGVTALRGRQADAIDAINSGCDVVYLFPTGTGKTVVYEAAALCSSYVSIVVSPLVGLAQQQAERLASRGVGVIEAWDGNLMQRGASTVSIIYTTPEQLADGSQLRRHIAATALETKRLVIDEAHVVVQWDQFRCYVSSQ